MECNLRNAIVSMSQSRDQLENGRCEDDKIFRRVW